MPAGNDLVLSVPSLPWLVRPRRCTGKGKHRVGFMIIEIGLKQEKKPSDAPTCVVAQILHVTAPSLGKMWSSKLVLQLMIIEMWLGAGEGPW